MEMFLKAFLSLLFVLGLLFLTFGLLRYLQNKTEGKVLWKKINKSSRLKIIEVKKIDMKNSLALVACDDEEHLVVLGAGQNLVLSKGKKNEN